MYGDVVLDMKPKDKHDTDPFEKILEEVKHKAEVQYDSELSVDQLKDVVVQFKKMVKEQTGKDFPTEPMEQVWGAIGAVFGSWMNDRAVVYRRQYNIPHEWGTATNVQAMVFGNLGNDCATGVGLTRDGALGLPGFNGDYLINAQGEDVVAGIRTPKRIEIDLAKRCPKRSNSSITSANARAALQGRAGHRVYDPARQGVDAANPQRQADRFRRRTNRRRLGQRGDDHRAGGLQKRRIPADDLNQLLQPIFDPKAKKRIADSRASC